MQKKNVPLRNGTPYLVKSLHPFSNGRELSEAEWFCLRLASTTSFRFSEPKSITRARSRIESAEMARDHLLNSDLVPVFDSFDFEAMELKGVRS